MSVGALPLARKGATISTAAVELSALVPATLLCLYLRLVHTIAASFPVNDGGLFYIMARDVQNAHYMLPQFTTYNGGQIPFAYSPLPFYIAALCSDLGHVALIDVIRILPAVVCSLMVPLVYLIARRVLGSPVQAAIAAGAFAVLPRSYEWLIMGGGLTRSFGLLFALCAFYFGYLSFTHSLKSDVIWCALFVALTVLSHPETAVFLGWSLALLCLLYGRSFAGLIKAACIALGGLLIAAPWVITVVSRHGLGPFQAAMSTGGLSVWSWLTMLGTRPTEEPFLDLLAVIGVIGVFACIAQKKALPPLWLLSSLILTPRSGDTFAMVPLAMLIAVSLDQVILPQLARLERAAPAGPTSNEAGIAETAPPVAWVIAKAPKAAMIFILLYAIFSAYFLPVTASDALRTVSLNERTAMEWVRSNTPTASKFAVVSGTPDWVVDMVSEWFPALTGHVSVATVQGQEWVQGGFQRSQGLNTALQGCASADVQCLQNWESNYHESFSYVFIPKGETLLLPAGATSGDTRARTADLVKSLSASPVYKVAYDGPGAIIFAQQGH